MALEAPPKEKASLFDHIDIHGNYVGVLRPEKTDDGSDIEIPETAERQESMENATARVAVLGSEVDHLEKGDKVFVSLYMQQPHQIIVEHDERGEEYHMFIIDSDMVVATENDQQENVSEMLETGSV